MNARLPVTLVGGFLGAGKTSLLHHFISEHHGGYLALLVENPDALNLDAKALRGLCGAMRRLHDTVLEIPNADETTQLEWIAARLRELSSAGRYEQVLIEVAGTTNPAHLAEHFLPEGIFSPWAELQQVVCVVDALDYFQNGNQPASQNLFSNYQRDQIASATLIVLNKCDLVPDQERIQCVNSILTQNSTAQLIETAYGEIPPEILSRPASAENLKTSVQRRDSVETPTTSNEPELSAAVYRAYHPFHPGRFWDWFNADHPGLLRVKGLVWLATRNLLVGGVSRTRWQNSCGAAGIWWAALPREEWPEETAALARMQETWREPYGDRRQELVLIGNSAQVSNTLRHELDACLLTAEEFALPVEQWSSFPDPFPAWDLED
jgi:G3E family GTPase